MKNFILIQIYDKRKKTYIYKDELKKDDFKFNKKAYGKSFWEKKIEENEQGKIYIEEKQNEYKKKGLKVVLISSNFVRSNDYRKEFFSHYKGFKDKYYLCAYCSKLLTKDEVSVDHIIPISKVSKNKFLQSLIKMMKIEDVNSYKNLVASCSKCNNYKRSKLTALYVLRGFLGKYIASHILFLGSLILFILFIIIKVI